MSPNSPFHVSDLSARAGAGKGLQRDRSHNSTARGDYQGQG